MEPRYTKGLEYQRILFARLHLDILIKNKLAAGRHIDLHNVDRMLAFKVRLCAFKVQDRVVRLEERLRLATLLPEPLRSRIVKRREDRAAVRHSGAGGADAG